MKKLLEILTAPISIIAVPTVILLHFVNPTEPKDQPEGKRLTNAMIYAVFTFCIGYTLYDITRRGWNPTLRHLLTIVGGIAILVLCVVIISAFVDKDNPRNYGTGYFN